MLHPVAVVLCQMARVVMAVMIMAVMMVVMPMVMVVIMTMIGGAEEIGFDVEDAVEIEGTAAEHHVERHRTALGAVQLGIGIDAADARLDFGEFGRRHEVRLVQENDVGEGDLAFRFRRVLQPRGEPFRIGDRDDGVEPGRGADIGVDEEGLGDGGRIGETRRLDDDRIEFAAPLHQPLEDADEIAAHGAADAAVVHLEDFLVGADDELVVDADFAELVDDDGIALPVRLGEDAIEQRRLARAEIAGENGDGDFFGHRTS